MESDHILHQSRSPRWGHHHEENRYLSTGQISTVEALDCLQLFIEEFRDGVCASVEHHAQEFRPGSLQSSLRFLRDLPTRLFRLHHQDDPVALSRRGKGCIISECWWRINNDH